MGRSIGSMSSPPGLNLSNRAVTVWRRGKVKANRLLDNSFPSMRVARKPPCALPSDVVEMITAYLTDDLGTLKACSLTCRCWYIAAVPHVHHTLILGDERPDKRRDKLKPLSRLHELGLMPLVKTITVRQWLNSNWFTPQAFGPRDLHYFSAFTNVQTLKLEHMDIFRFMPSIERYFEHFSPTLRSITLWDPRCTPRQLSHFLSLFSNLDDVYIWRGSALAPFVIIDDTELTSFSAPELRGQLTLHDFCWADTWTHLITSAGGLRFRYMNLYKAGGCGPILLKACAGSLETLRFYTLDDSARFPEFNLSQLKVLRSLQVGDWATRSISAGARHAILMGVFSTITSPVFSELVLILRGDDITYSPPDVNLFETLRAMSEIRPFKLVFSLAVSNRFQGEVRRKLVEALGSVTARDSLGFLDSPPTIRAE